MDKPCLFSSPLFDNGYEIHQQYHKDKHYEHIAHIVIEEASEVIKELIKEYRGRDVQNNIKEEIADLLFCIEYLVRVKGYNLTELQELMNKKTIKMIENIKKGKK